MPCPCPRATAQRWGAWAGGCCCTAPKPLFTVAGLLCTSSTVPAILRLAASSLLHSRGWNQGPHFHHPCSRSVRLGASHPLTTPPHAHAQATSAADLEVMDMHAQGRTINREAAAAMQVRGATPGGRAGWACAAARACWHEHGREGRGARQCSMCAGRCGGTWGLRPPAGVPQLPLSS